VCLWKISRKAVQAEVSKGFRILQFIFVGRSFDAWLRQVILKWASESGRSAPRVAVLVSDSGCELNRFQFCLKNINNKAIYEMN